MIRAPRVSRSVVGFGCLHFFKVPVPKIYDGWERSWSERMFLVPARCCVSLKTIFVCFSFPFFVFKGYVCCLWWDVFWIVSFSLPEVIINSASNMCSYFSWHHLYSRHHFMTCTHTHTHTHTHTYDPTRFEAVWQNRVMFPFCLIATFEEGEYIVRLIYICLKVMVKICLGRFWYGWFPDFTAFDYGWWQECEVGWFIASCLACWVLIERDGNGFEVNVLCPSLHWPRSRSTHTHYITRHSMVQRS